MSDHKHNSIDYVEFSGKNSDSITQIKNFYSDAFGWKFNEWGASYIDTDSSGIACGFVIDFGDINIYFAGDTALFSDMQLIGRKERIDYALLPIGDNYTMGIEDAAVAAQLLGARHVIPMHYDTWPVVAQDVEQYKQLTEQMSRAEVHVVAPGGKIEHKKKKNSL